MECLQNGPKCCRDINRIKMYPVSNDLHITQNHLEYYLKTLLVGTNDGEIPAEQLEYSMNENAYRGQNIISTAPKML